MARVWLIWLLLLGIAGPVPALRSLCQERSCCCVPAVTSSDCCCEVPESGPSPCQLEPLHDRPVSEVPRTSKLAESPCVSVQVLVWRAFLAPVQEPRRNLPAGWVLPSSPPLGFWDLALPPPAEFLLQA